MESEKYKNKNWLEEKLEQDALLLSEIAQICEVSITTISRWAARFEIREIRHYEVDRKGENNPYWKGGKYKDNASGYIMVYNPEHPNANKKGYLPEHRLKMEEYLGRLLKPNEIVCHKNKQKDDNRLKNLEIVVLGEPEGIETCCPFCEERFRIG